MPVMTCSEVAPSFGLRLGRKGQPDTFAVSTGPGATGVDLCLFPANGPEAGTELRVPLTNRLGTTWWEHLAPGLVAAGTRYGIRVDGRGHNPAKLLADPWALAYDGSVDWLTVPGGHALSNPTDTAPLTLRSVAVDQDFDWGDEERPDTPWTSTVIYEVHVKGATKTHPGIPKELRKCRKTLLQRLSGWLTHLLVADRHCTCRNHYSKWFKQPDCCCNDLPAREVPPRLPHCGRHETRP